MLLCPVHGHTVLVLYCACGVYMFPIICGVWYVYNYVVKAGSQSDAKPCVALVRETHKFITKKVGGFLTTRHKNATQGNTRIGAESILASYCVSTSVDVKTTQRNALFSVVL